MLFGSDWAHLYRVQSLEIELRGSYIQARQLSSAGPLAQKARDEAGFGRRGSRITMRYERCLSSTPRGQEQYAWHLNQRYAWLAIVRTGWDLQYELHLHGLTLGNEYSRHRKKLVKHACLCTAAFQSILRVRIVESPQHNLETSLRFIYLSLA